MKPIKLFVNILVCLGSLAYPFVWYWGQERIGIHSIALMMALLWALRCVLAKQSTQKVLAAGIAVFFTVIAWRGSSAGMYWYPVWVNLGMLAVFGGSLLTPQSMVERFARMQHPDLPQEGVRYTRRVTQIWCGFFCLNLLIVLGLIEAEWWRAWALYSGVIAYVLMSGLFLGEWLYRRLILKI